jgi:thiamine biosynthesis protein ThiS
MVAVERLAAAQADGLGSKVDNGGNAAPPAIEIRLNGEPRRIPTGMTVAGLLRLLDIEGDRVAVELNRSIVRRTGWETSAIEPDAAVEVVHFVGGG